MALTRVSPGVYRNAKGNLVQGIPKAAPAKKKSKSAPRDWGDPNAMAPGATVATQLPGSGQWLQENGMAPPPNPQPGPQPTPEAPAQPAPVFRSVNDFINRNYEASPIYQYQKQEGLKDLERLYAARGLTGSGAEIEGNKRLLNELGSQEAQRGYERAATDAGRFDAQSQAEADRLRAVGNDQWGRQMDILNFQGKQNPFEQAYNTYMQSAATGLEKGKAGAQYAANNYNRVVGGGPSGGGTPAPQFTPPFPSSPNNMMSQLYSANNRGNTAENLFSAALNGLGAYYSNRQPSTGSDTLKDFYWG